MARDESTPVAEVTRSVLELSAEENAELCRGCTRCCETVCIEIDAPRAPWEYDQWIWVLHHQNLELYVERPERWFLHIESKCRQLESNGRCRIHGEHPVLCREYDARDCERRAPLSDVVAWFKCAEDLERWLEQRRPGHWARLQAHRLESAAAAPAPTTRALVRIAEPAAHEPATRLRSRPPLRPGRTA